MNDTVPAGVPEFGDVVATTAVKVTDWPVTAEPDEATSVVLVADGLTTHTAAGDVRGRKLLSPW